MPDNPVFVIREEIQLYFRSCQHLLAAASNPPPFTQEERAIIKYYMAEIEKTLPVTQRTMASRK